MNEPATTIELLPYDPVWPALFAREAVKIRAALGPTAVEVHHAGSTSVPGLSAKPVIDIVLAVPDSTDEGIYVPQLEAAGFQFRFREPEWFEHRFLKGAAPMVNLHVFSHGCAEIERMLIFRDWLIADEEDRLLYERTKHALAKGKWGVVQDYADAKTEVVQAIIGRALSARDAGSRRES